MKYWIVGALVVVLAAVAWYLYVRSEPTVEEPVAPGPTLPVEEPQPPPVTPPVTEPVVTEPAPEPEPEVATPALPDLADSDGDAMSTLSALVGDSAPVRHYVVGDGVISRFVASVDALDGKQVPAVIQAVEGPGGEFQATPVEHPETVIRNEVGDAIPQYRLDPANFRRYAPYVEMLEAVDPADLVTAYQTYEPLLEEAFDQLGYPDGDFETRLVTVIDDLLATPEPERPIELIKPEAYYQFADEDLESLSAGQKVLLRMGPDNAARVKAKLAQIRDALTARTAP